MAGRRSIVVVPHRRTWPAKYEAEAARLADGLRETAVRIEHVGSTGVPGLEAKPVIDIQISVIGLHPLERHVEAMADLGYTHLEHLDDVIYPFFHRPEGWPHSHHVHLCEAGGEEERRHLAFRDFLRDHPAVAREYGELKHRLASVHTADTPETRNAFSEAKSSFIEPLIRRAVELKYPRS